MSDDTSHDSRGNGGWRPLRVRRGELAEIRDLLLRIDTALVVRDPGGARSADAYEGLRRQVAAAASDRRKHIVQLTELAEAVRRGESLVSLESRVGEWMLQANIVAVDDPSLPGAFELVGERGSEAQVVSPAYVDNATGAVIRRGIAEWTKPSVETVEASALETRQLTPAEPTEGDGGRGEDSAEPSAQHPSDETEGTN